MLGHAAGSVTSRYVHHLDAVLIAAADKVARMIHSYMTGQAAITKCGNTRFNNWDRFMDCRTRGEESNV